MTGQQIRTLLFGLIGGVALTAIMLTRASNPLLVVLASPLFLALSTYLVESFVWFDAGKGFGKHPGFGVIGWCVLCSAAIALLMSFIT